MSIKASAIAATFLLATICLQQPAFALGGEKVAKIQEAVSFDPTADHAGEANALIWVNQPGGARGVKKVIVPFFQVQFVTDSMVGATGAGGANAKMSMHLSGPTPEQMQAVTNEAYEAFILGLKDQGIEVVSPQQAATYSNYNDLIAHSRVPGETVKGMNNVTSNFYSPAGLPYYMLPTMLPEYAGGGSMSVVGNSQNIQREVRLLDEAGAAVIGFRVVVDFATLQASNRKGLRALARNAKTKGEAGLVIRPVATQMFLITPAAKATMIDPQYRMRFELQAPLELESDAILSTADNRTTGQKRGEAIGNAISMLGGVGMSKSKSFEVAVDPAVWQSDVSGAIKGVIAAMMTRLKGEL